MAPYQKRNEWKSDLKLPRDAQLAMRSYTERVTNNSEHDKMDK